MLPNERNISVKSTVYGMNGIEYGVKTFHTEQVRLLCKFIDDRTITAYIVTFELG